MNNYYTIEPSQTFQGTSYSSWQPQQKINNKLHVDANINSNWTYRQYIQKNAKEIMKFNSMQYINDSGNNPYTILNTQQTQFNPFMYNSVHDTNHPMYCNNDSELKRDYIKSQQIRSRMVAPTISLNNK